MTRFTFALATVMLMLGVSSAWAVPIGVLEIQFTGLNLTYASSTISDSTSALGGSGNPTQADPLVSVEFLVNGSSVGSLNSDVFADVSIPDVTGIADSLVPTNIVTPGTTPGYFDLLIGPTGTEYLRLDTTSVTVTYVSVSNTVNFLFGGAVVGIDAQDLPFDITVGDPVSVSFITSVNSGSKTTSGGFVTGFTASGTGSIDGLAVPEPAVCILAAVGMAATIFTRSRS